MLDPQAKTFPVNKNKITTNAPGCQPSAIPDFSLRKLRGDFPATHRSRGLLLCINNPFHRLITLLYQIGWICVKGFFEFFWEPSFWRWAAGVRENFKLSEKTHTSAAGAAGGRLGEPSLPCFLLDIGAIELVGGVLEGKGLLSAAVEDQPRGVAGHGRPAAVLQIGGALDKQRAVDGRLRVVGNAIGAFQQLDGDADRASGHPDIFHHEADIFGDKGIDVQQMSGNEEMPGMLGQNLGLKIICPSTCDT